MSDTIQTFDEDIAFYKVWILAVPPDGSIFECRANNPSFFKEVPPRGGRLQSHRKTSTKPCWRLVNARRPRLSLNSMRGARVSKGRSRKGCVGVVCGGHAMLASPRPIFNISSPPWPSILSAYSSGWLVSSPLKLVNLPLFAYTLLLL